MPREVTVTPDSEVTDFAEGDFVPFKDFRRACLSEGVISSEFLEWLKPAFCILSIRTVSEIFKVFAKSFTVNFKIFLFYLNQCSLAFIIIDEASSFERSIIS